MAKFHRNHNGFVPTEVLLEIVSRNPDNLSLLQTLAGTQQLWSQSAARTAPWFRFVNAGNADRIMFNANNGYSLPGKKARGEGDPAAADAVVNECFDYLGTIREYYRKVHGRNSIDANGMTLKGVCHYGKGYNNAFWNSEYMVTGDGDGKIFATFNLLNVWAHEMGHGVTEYAVPGGIDYYGMAGAANESFSDITGANVETWVLNISAKQYHWLVGKGLWVPSKDPKAVRRALRDMMNPGTAYNDPSLGKDRQPGHMKDYVKTSSDNGGVHINSGIMNKFYAEFAVSLDGEDWESTMGKASRIFYAARGALQTSRPTFGLIAYLAKEACAALYPNEAASLQAKLQAAADKVGIVIDKNAIDDLTPVLDDEAA
jgi:Zn-dependent metalloprotease